MSIRDKLIVTGVIIILIIQFLPFINSIMKPDQQNFLNNSIEEPGSRSTRSSNWFQSSFSDFNNGTSNNLTLIGSGMEAELRLKSIELNKWTEKTPQNSPLERQFHALAQIWGTDKILLFGGSKDEYSLFNDTWIYDLSENKWSQKYPANHPSARNYHAMASVWGTDKIVLMGGGKNTSYAFNDTWVYDFSDNTWTNVTTTTNPGRIIQHSMGRIFGDDKVVLHGGLKGVIHNETWIYDLSDNEWIHKFPTTNSPASAMFAMASIWGTDKVLLFGGYDNENSTWVYDFSENTWTQRAYGPPGRLQHDIATIYGTDKVVLFAGFGMINSIPIIYNDTWIFDYSENSWTKKSPINNPGEKFSHLMASVWGTDKIVLFSGFNGPLVNNTWIFDPFEYVDNGTFTSSPYDIGLDSSFKTISWEYNVSVNTTVRSQLRTAETKADLNSNNFIGPSGSSSSYYTFSPTAIWLGHNDDRWIQYKAYLSTTNSEETPRLKNVTIIYNYWPNTTLIKPDNGSIINNSCQIFTWNFTDPDSMNQSAFRVTIDDDINFESVDYNSNEQSSTNRYWHFPNGTDYTRIADGIWYWRVRTKDNDGDWGHYSQPWKIIIDTSIPSSIITNPVNKFLNNLDKISGIASDSLDGTGLNYVKIAIKCLNDNSYWTGQKWADSETWLMTSGTTKWSYDASSVIWYTGFKYEIRSRATDNASNIEIPKAGKNFTMDFDNVTFSNVFPSYNNVSINEEVEVGITISDQISGVNASTIEYKVSENEGKTWSSWEPVNGLVNGNTVNVTFNLTFPNGTSNRLKWRATDVAGNGPRESKAYIIKVNTWLQIFIPTVRLWSPPNGSTVPTNSVKLQWFLENSNLAGVTYDLYIDTISPTKPNITSLFDSSYLMDDLIDGETYYWMVIPILDSEEGTCTSGVWSFTVDTTIEFPRVTLVRPENGSIVSSTKPTLAWSVEYYGSEALSYEVYLDSQPELITYEESFNKYYLPSIILEDNQTYYWKVIPKAGSIVGPESEIWSFTVKKDYVPHFELELRVEPAAIVMPPASIKTINAFVTNKGELTDRITLSIELPSDSDMGGIVNEPNILETDPGETANFSIMLTTTQNIEPGEVIITVTATSGEASDFGIEYKKELKVKVIILDEEEPEPEKVSEWLYIWGMLIIVIVIILALIIFFVLRRKKKAKEPIPENIPDTQEPIETPIPIETQEPITPEGESDKLKTPDISTQEQVQEKIPEQPPEPGPEQSTIITDELKEDEQEE